MTSLRHTTVIAAGLSLAIATQGLAADQPQMGPWNAGAAKTAEGSPLVTSSLAYIKAQLATVKDDKIRRETEDAAFNPNVCIRHRVGLDDAKKQRILDTLQAESLVDPTEAGRIPGGLLAGMFPPLRDEGTDCPKLPQPYGSAPGSVFGGHHSQPGGLAVHVAANLMSAQNLADTYRHVYGTLDSKGMPIVRTGEAQGAPDPAFEIDQGIVIGAPIWHDWAKAIVFQWNADGSEFPEMNFAGNGKTDMWGAPGSTKTGAHHLIGVAETIARDLPPAFIIAHASAHGAPNAGNEHNTVNFIRTAAIMAGADPVAKGYLIKDATGRLRIAPVRQLGATNILSSLPNQSNLLYEYVLHNLSDADYTFTGPAAVQSDLFLRLLASKFAYDPADATRYNTAYRNPVLSHLGAERIQILYAHGGLDAVEREIGKLKSAGVIK